MNRNTLKEIFKSLEEQWSCSITQHPVQSPVSTSDGHTYDKQAIQTWLKDSKISPATNLPLQNTHLVPNMALKNIKEKIQKYWPIISKEQKKLLTQKQQIKRQFQLQKEQYEYLAQKFNLQGEFAKTQMKIKKLQQKKLQTKLNQLKELNLKNSQQQKTIEQLKQKVCQLQNKCKISPDQILLKKIEQLQKQAKNNKETISKLKVQKQLLQLHQATMRHRLINPFLEYQPIISSRLINRNGLNESHQNLRQQLRERTNNRERTIRQQIRNHQEIGEGLEDLIQVNNEQRLTIANNLQLSSDNSQVSENLLMRDNQQLRDNQQVSQNGQDQVQDGQIESQQERESNESEGNQANNQVQASSSHPVCNDQQTPLSRLTRFRAQINRRRFGFIQL